MKTEQLLQVAAGVILHPMHPGKFLLSKRPMDRHLGGLWEFAGGKIEADETPERAIIRELKEEFDVEVTVNKKVTHHIYHYPEVSLELHTFEVVITSGDIKLLEHDEISWVTIDDVDKYPIAPSNKMIIDYLRIKH
ncbi:NUDIX domain-containing protein [Flammeovirga yaeyamensis]|uniref:8-oxo-dGTP diphosphatase n=1 Tax=Flammeovirga yaeyamensis TaxID=367791 RepID=A0AAX1N7M6_9BACT|nr:(deoxy)nucleoside triphosphate pyrophosphohydrolase [Flammeovirga yaeyamensis]MBB3699149.1 8-oxo-dGTP diphosphatase [Flammeovirga yaeyamensis]NMF36582.1 (deoxy)nucleoside triphosphate pyrophosphohydrolase [Flammeovirga yaeyamensis]QWG03462.1 NUDIX domain-containing protein [Flammeovirga yaeyamensis]